MSSSKRSHQDAAADSDLESAQARPGKRQRRTGNSTSDNLHKESTEFGQEPNNGEPSPKNMASRILEKSKSSKPNDSYNTGNVTAHQRAAARELTGLLSWAREQAKKQVGHVESAIDDRSRRRQKRMALAPSRGQARRDGSEEKRINFAYRVKKQKPRQKNKLPLLDHLEHLPTAAVFEGQYRLVNREIEDQSLLEEGADKAESQQPETPGLLQLPAELRNSIYSYVLGGETTFTISKRNKSTGQQYAIFPDHPPDWFSWTFTQVCRQIRAEYGSILRDVRTMRVDLDNLTAYLNDFHPAIDDGNPHKLAGGHIELLWGDWSLRPSIDVLALAKANDASPDLRLHFQNRNLGETHELKTIRRIIRTYPRWRGLATTFRMRSIRLHSKRRNLGAGGDYDRFIKVDCEATDQSVRNESEHRMHSWLFETELAGYADYIMTCKMPDITVRCCTVRCMALNGTLVTCREDDRKKHLSRADINYWIERSKAEASGSTWTSTQINGGPSAKCYQWRRA